MKRCSARGGASHNDSLPGQNCSAIICQTRSLLVENTFVCAACRMHCTKECMHQMALEGPSLKLEGLSEHLAFAALCAASAQDRCWIGSVRCTAHFPLKGRHVPLNLCTSLSAPTSGRGRPWCSRVACGSVCRAQVPRQQAEAAAGLSWVPVVKDVGAGPTAQVHGKQDQQGVDSPALAACCSSAACGCSGMRFQAATARSPGPSWHLPASRRLKQNGKAYETLPASTHEEETAENARDGVEFGPVDCPGDVIQIRRPGHIVIALPVVPAQHNAAGQSAFEIRQ
jgi:hypothetical protein